MKIGKASYGGNKKTYFKIKDGDNTYRILPPLGDLADDGIWSMFYKIHYGYKNSEGKLHPFQSSLVKNFKTKMIEVPDAALERIEKLKAQLELAKKNGDKKMVEKLNEFVGPKGSYNLDSNHYVNAIDLQGNIGILKLRHRAKVALDSVMKGLREKGIDPLDPDSGRYFTITRSGNALDTTFQVKVFTKSIMVDGVGEVEQQVVHKLDESTIKRLSKEAADLSKLFKSPTAEQIERIVKEGATAVDEILDGKGNGSAAGGGGEDYDDSEDYSDDSTSAAATTTVTAEQVIKSAESTVNTTIAAATETKVETKVTTPVQASPAQVSASVATASATTAAQVGEQSEKDFLASLGL